MGLDEMRSRDKSLSYELGEFLLEEQMSTQPLQLAVVETTPSDTFIRISSDSKPPESIAWLHYSFGIGVYHGQGPLISAIPTGCGDDVPVPKDLVLAQWRRPAVVVTAPFGTFFRPAEGFGLPSKLIWIHVKSGAHTGKQPT